MGVCSERTKGTKIMESSSESLTMNMKPRLNMQVAAACWTLRQCGKQSCRSTPRDCKPLSRKEKGPQRPVIGGLLGKNCGTTWEGGRTWSSAGRSWFRWGGRPLPAPGSEQDNGSWALTPACLPVLPVESNPALRWQEESELFCHPGKQWRKQRASLPLCGRGGCFI